MRQDKQIKEHAKQLLGMSLDNGQVSSEHVQGVLEALDKNPPRNHLAVLKSYLKLVEKEEAKSTAIVEHAGEISEASLQNIASNMTEIYGRPITVTTKSNPDLIAGIRVTVDCDAYDASVAASLNSLEASLSS